MLPRADLNANRPPATVATATPATSSTDPRQEVFQRLSRIDIGREVTATVLSRFDDGSHLVRIADAQARMMLPVGTRVGDQLQMMFIAPEPRPTFLLTGQSGSVNASLSDAARLIDHLLQSTPKDGSASVRGAAPLLPHAGIDAGQLAARLQQALSLSGLFYESHLQEWIVGGRTLADLKREPQARLGTQPPPAPGAEAAEPGRLAAALRELGNAHPALLRLLREAQAQGDARGLDAQLLARGPAPLPELDPELARLLQQQLNTLEQQQIRWRGELWPGQSMEWDVTEERSRQDPDNREASVWTSTVRFELPHLGPVEAILRMTGARLQVQVRTDSDDATVALRTFAPMLAEALEAAGAPLDAFQVTGKQTDVG